MTTRTLLLAAALLAGLAAPAAAQTRVLAFGDSNTWGWSPTPAGFPATRLADSERWAGVLEARLGSDATVVVDGLVGRRTDIAGSGPIGLLPPGEFDGRAELASAIARAMPVDLVVVMLGTNDLQAGVGRTPEEIARAAFGLSEIVSGSAGAVFSAYPAPALLVVAPPAMGDTSGTPLGPLFGPGEAPSRALGATFAAAAGDIPYFDAGSVVTIDGPDGIHMSADDHRALGEALAPVVRALLAD